MKTISINIFQFSELSDEAAYDWDNADEQVDENIIANEYEFTEDGEVAK